MICICTMVQGINIVELEPFCTERAGALSVGWYRNLGTMTRKWRYLLDLTSQN